MPHPTLRLIAGSRPYRQQRVTDVLAEIEDFLPADGVPRSFPDQLSESIEIVLRELALRGFVVGPGGRVVSAWRERARGRWVDRDEIVCPERACGRLDDAVHLVRVEGAHVAEVNALDGQAWTIFLNGVHIGSIVGRQAALRVAEAALGLGPPAGNTSSPARTPEGR